MSLIQDALKRQQEESESSRVPLKAATAPSVPEAMPVPPSPPAIPDTALRAGPEPLNRPLPALPVEPGKQMPSGKSWKRIAGIIIFCVLITWSGVLLTSLILKQSAQRALPDLFMPNRANIRESSGQPVVQAPSPAAMPKPEAVHPPVSAAAVRPWISPAAAAAPAFADEGEDAQENTAWPGAQEQDESAAVSSLVPRPQQKRAAIFSNAGSDQAGARAQMMVWPRLKLSAVFSNAGSGRAGARLNDRLVLLGDQIDNVTLVEIRPDGVRLKYGAEIRFLKMGATLN